MRLQCRGREVCCHLHSQEIVDEKGLEDVFRRAFIARGGGGVTHEEGHEVCPLMRTPTTTITATIRFATPRGQVRSTFLVTFFSM